MYFHHWILFIEVGRIWEDLTCSLAGEQGHGFNRQRSSVHIALPLLHCTGIAIPSGDPLHLRIQQLPFQHLWVQDWAVKCLTWVQWFLSPFCWCNNICILTLVLL